MISGYIMIQKIPSYENLLHFSRRRIRRLWPPLFITLLFSLPISFVVSGTKGNDEITIENYLISLFMLNPMLFNGVFGTSLNYPFQILWTISVEITFYFVIAFIYFFLGRRNLQLLVVLLFIGSTSVFLQLSGFSQFSIRSFVLAVGTVYFPYFIFGCSVWLILKKEKGRHVMPAIFIAIVSLFLAMVSTSRPEGEPHQALVIAGIALLFFSLAAYETISQRFSYRALEVIGDYSYEIYLVHGIIIFPLIEYLLPLHLLDKLNVGTGSLIFELLFVIVASVLVLLTSYFLQYVISRTFIKS